MLNMQANAAVSEQQNCFYVMYKFATDLKIGPLDCIWPALQTEPTIIFVPLWMNLLKFKASFSS